MPTPARVGYGKRKRRSEAELMWDVSIDKSPLKDLSTKSDIVPPLSSPLSSTSTIPGHRNALAFRSLKSPIVNKRDHADVYDFESETEANDHDFAAKNIPRPRSSKAASIATDASKSTARKMSFRRVKGKEKEVLRSPLQSRNSQTGTSQLLHDKDMTRAIDLSKAEARALSYIDSGPSGIKIKTNASPESANDPERMPEVPKSPVEFSSSHSPQIQLQLAPSKRVVHSVLESTSERTDSTATPDRCRTPIEQQIPDVQDQTSTPQHDAIAEMFGDGMMKFQSRPSKPRRILRQLSKLGNSPIKRQTSSFSDRDDGSFLDRLLQDAENNLVEQSQRTLEADTEESVQTDLKSFGDNDNNAKQNFLHISRSTYSRQNTSLIENQELNSIETGSNCSSEAPGSGSETENDDIAFKSPKAVKNVHDLRHGGENKRFLDHVNYILEGLDSTKTNLITLLELNQKFARKDFLQRFRAANLQTQLWGACQAISDPVSLFVMVVLMTIVSQGMEMPKLEPVQYSILEKALHFDKDIKLYLDGKSARVSKINQLSVIDMRAELAQSPVFRSLLTDQQISPRLLSLMTMNSCVPQRGVLDEHETLLETLLQGLKLEATCSTIEQQLTTAILETFSSQVLSKLTTQHIRCLAIALLEVAQGSAKDTASSSASCNILRLLISIANEDARQVQLSLPVTFANDFMACLLNRLSRSSHLHETSSDLDQTVLMLGLTVSLVEESAEFKHSVLEFLNAKDLRHQELTNFLQDGMKKTAGHTIAGYTALLLFHLNYSASTLASSDARSSDKLIADRETVKAGLNMLHTTLAEDLSDDNEFMKTLERHIAYLAAR